MSITFPIYVKPPQSGKTKDAIIKPMVASIKKGRVPVIIIPSRIQLQKQLTSRILDTLKQCDDNHISKIIKNCDIDDKVIGRFDTGNLGSKLSGAEDAVSGLESGSIKAFVVLNNIQGMTKLLCTMVQTDKLFDIIVDEVHGFFNVGNVDEEDLRFSINNQFWNVYNHHNKMKGILSHKKIKIDNVTAIAILFDLIKKHNHSFSGTTATISFVAQSKILDIFDLEPTIVKLETPPCYNGYDEVYKKTYDGNYRNAIESIIQANPDGTVTMCHVGHKQELHYEAANEWIDFCLLNDVSRTKTLAIVDNSDGYSIYNWKKSVKTYDKTKTSEPWKLVNFYRNECGFTHIGIFGDRCMSESNTYQKCSDGINCPINDLIVVPFSHSITDMTIMIQKIGRIFGNDTNGGNSRTIWFPHIADKKSFQLKLEEGLSLDSYLQDQVKIRDLDIKSIVRKITKPDSLDKKSKYIDMRDRFIKYRTSTTKIAKFVRSLDSELIYNKGNMISLLEDAGYKNPEQMLHSFCKDDGFSLYLLQCDKSMYSLIPSAAEIHHLVQPLK